MLLSHTSRIRTARSKSHSNLKSHVKHSNTLNYIILHTFEYSNTLWTHFESQLNSGKYAGVVSVFFSSIYTFLEQQFLQLNSYFLHFEFQIINRSVPIQNNNFLGDDNTCHISFQIVNKSLLNSSSRSNCFVTVFRLVWIWPQDVIGP